MNAECRQNGGMESFIEDSVYVPRRCSNVRDEKAQLYFQCHELRRNHLHVYTGARLLPPPPKL